MVSGPDPTALPPRCCRNVGFLPPGAGRGPGASHALGCFGYQKLRPAGSHAEEEALCSKARARRPRPQRLAPCPGPGVPSALGPGLLPRKPAPRTDCGPGPHERSVVGEKLRPCVARADPAGCRAGHGAWRQGLSPLEDAGAREQESCLVDGERPCRGGLVRRGP